MYYNSSQYVPKDMTPVKSGKYPFTVVGATETQSKAGNDMISLELQVDIPDRDNPIKVFDYLVATPDALFKIEQFCMAVGLDFGADELREDELIGLVGKADFVLGLPKENGNRYLQVKQYLKLEGYTEQPVKNTPAAETKQPVAAAKSPLSGDDIPF